MSLALVFLQGDPTHAGAFGNVWRPSGLLYYLCGTGHSSRHAVRRGQGMLPSTAPATRHELALSISSIVVERV